MVSNYCPGLYRLPSQQPKLEPQPKKYSQGSSASKASALTSLSVPQTLTTHFLINPKPGPDTLIWWPSSQAPTPLSPKLNPQPEPDTALIVNATRTPCNLQNRKPWHLEEQWSLQNLIVLTPRTPPNLNHRQNPRPVPFKYLKADTLLVHVKYIHLRTSTLPLCPPAKISWVQIAPSPRVTLGRNKTTTVTKKKKNPGTKPHTNLIPPTYKEPKRRTSVNCFDV